MYEKLIQSGNLLEIYQYEKSPPSLNKFKVRKRRSFGGVLSFKSKRNIVRSRESFYRKVRANLVRGAPHLLTLTTVDTFDLKKAYKFHSQFFKKIKKQYGHHIIWISVPEFQRRGAVHFHSLVWGLPYDAHISEFKSRDLQALWQRGWLDICLSDGRAGIAGYMAKYMSKAMSDRRLFGQKSYSATRGALRSVLLRTRTSIAIVKEEFGVSDDLSTESSTLSTVRERVYSTEWLGRCHYRAYETGIVNKNQHEGDSD